MTLSSGSDAPVSRFVTRVRWIFHLHRFISNRLFNRLTAYTGVNEIF
jgi:hypothetical protein